MIDILLVHVSVSYMCVYIYINLSIVISLGILLVKVIASFKFCHSWFRIDSLTVPVTLASEYLFHRGKIGINPLISHILLTFLFGNNEILILKEK